MRKRARAYCPSSVIADFVRLPFVHEPTKYSNSSYTLPAGSRGRGTHSRVRVILSCALPPAALIHSTITEAMSSCRLVLHPPHAQPAARCVPCGSHLALALALVWLVVCLFLCLSSKKKAKKTHSVSTPPPSKLPHAPAVSEVPCFLSQPSTVTVATPCLQEAEAEALTHE